MPKRYLLNDGRKSWNLMGDAVGYGTNASATDVKLTQHLLNVSSRYLKKQGRLDAEFGLTIDGIFGAKTHAAITKCQKTFHGSGLVDGRVSKMKMASAYYGSDFYLLYKLEQSYVADKYGIVSPDAEISVSLFNKAMDKLMSDPKLDASVKTEMAQYNS